MKARTVKKIVHAGRGPLPEIVDGTKVFFHYQAQLLPKDDQDGVNSDELTVIDDTRQPWPKGYGIPLEIVFGKKFQMPVWEECLKTMLLDEVATFDIQPVDLASYALVSKKLRDIAKERDHGHRMEDSVGHSCCGLAAQAGLGYAELDNYMADPVPLRFTFHLLKVLQPEDYQADSWQLDNEQRLQSVAGLKAQGNQLFAKKSWDEAAESYREAIARLETLTVQEKPGEPEFIELDNQKIPLYLNLAQCRLNQGDFYVAIQMVNEALDRDPANQKGLYRRAKAHIGTWDFGAARKDLDEMLKHHPESAKLVAQEMKNIATIEAQKDNEEKAQFLGKFL